MKTRTLATRIAILATVLLLVMTVLTGCFGGGKAQKTLTVGTISAGSENALSAEELKEIAELLAATCTTDFDTQEMLVAASRGYDLTKTDGNGKEFAEDKGVNLEAVKNVIAAANEKVDKEDKVTVDYSKINGKDVQTLISAFRTEVDTSSDGGILDVILVAIGAVLRWITNTLGFGNYLVGICVFAILIEIVMMPFAIKQQKNSIRQAQLRPKEMAIRNKYKGRNDQVTMQKMQQEIQEFYQRENFSPYSGCLQLLVQMPIIMALYYIVIDPLHYVLGQTAGVSAALSSYYSASVAAGGLGGTLASSNGTIAILADIAGMEGGLVGALEGLKDFAFFSNGSAVFEALDTISVPNFNIGPFNFGLIPSFERFDILLLVPVLTFVTYFLTSKLNRKFMAQPVANEGVEAKQVACSNTMMDVTMPLMSTFFTFAVPALVGVYWMFRSIVNLGKQFIISRLMPLPKFTEEDYKLAAKEMAGKKVVKKSENVGKVRSLHHIDDEDFDDTRERALARKAAIEEREKQEQAEKAKKTPFGASILKEDNKQSKENNDTQNNDQE